MFLLSSFLRESRNLALFSQKGYAMRQSIRHSMYQRGIPARALFPPLPSQAEIWSDEAAVVRAKIAAGRTGNAGGKRLALPALPFAELLMPFGMMTLSLVS